MSRKALLIGINNYANGKQLKGCVNDVFNMRDILRNYLGFRNTDIHVLIDERATKANILSRFEAIVSSAQADDYLVFYFSGHGSKIRDRVNGGLADNLDEIICPQDMNWDNGYILDDEFDNILSRNSKMFSFEVILDCCFSGLTPEDVRLSSIADPGRDTYRIDRFLPPPPDIRCRYEGEEMFLEAPRGFREVNRSGESGFLRQLLWMASRKNEPAFEIYADGSYHGAFTYAFCRVFRETEGFVKRCQFLHRISEIVEDATISQQPELISYEEEMMEKRPLLFPAVEDDERLLFHRIPYLEGDDVKEIQQNLLDVGFPLDITGVFDEQTRNVVMEYQRLNGLLVDGIVGPSVRKSLAT